MKLTPIGKAIALILLVGVAIGGWKLWTRFGDQLMPEAKTNGALVREGGAPDGTPIAVTRSPREGGASRQWGRVCGDAGGAPAGLRLECADGLLFATGGRSRLPEA